MPARCPANFNRSRARLLLGRPTSRAEERPAPFNPQRSARRDPERDRRERDNPEWGGWFPSGKPVTTHQTPARDIPGDHPDLHSFSRVFIVNRRLGRVRLDGGRSSARGSTQELRRKVNGKPYDLCAGSTVSALLETLALYSRVAVAVNGRVSPQVEHASHVLKDGDDVEVIHAVAGG